MHVSLPFAGTSQQARSTQTLIPSTHGFNSVKPNLGPKDVFVRFGTNEATTKKGDLFKKIAGYSFTQIPINAKGPFTKNSIGQRVIEAYEENKHLGETEATKRAKEELNNMIEEHNDSEGNT